MGDTRFKTPWAVSWEEHAFAGKSEPEAMGFLEEWLTEQNDSDGELPCGEEITIEVYADAEWCAAPDEYEDCYCGGTHADIGGGSFLIGWAHRRRVRCRVIVRPDGWVALVVRNG